MLSLMRFAAAVIALLYRWSVLRIECSPRKLEPMTPVALPLAVLLSMADHLSKQTVVLTATPGLPDMIILPLLGRCRCLSPQ